MNPAARITACLALGNFLLTGTAAAEPHLSKGQTIYVPVYSEVVVGKRGAGLPVHAAVFFRNTDPTHAVEMR